MTRVKKGSCSLSSDNKRQGSLETKYYTKTSHKMKMGSDSKVVISPSLESNLPKGQDDK